MRILARLMVVAAAIGAAALGVAAPARAGTLRCAQEPLRAGTPDILIVTCAEAEGDQRRGLSTVQNGTDQAIDVTELKALISFPQYGMTVCGPARLGPGAQFVCTSPWVTSRNDWSAARAEAYSLVRVTETDGRRTAAITNVHTTF
ncbi:hypothetical protein [Jidongwangia harbinensis]|uniref:hypothetical protein n=1 Tax=Jidongwangia harbinensis TaxID=2878561 RepID=UPI001CDA0CAB|nr:hypothetical protein [Jidongwangia harbinensis]MCA2211747.1 hypothetical protein [Jidongwangia harbinensis]